MKAKIQDIAYYLPESSVSNQEFQEENPSWDMQNVENHAGVVNRHVVRHDETALDLSFQACQKLFFINKDIRDKIDGIIFCTQSPDYIMPPNACILHKMLNLSENVFAFDFNLACSGFIYGLALAQGMIQSGISTNVLFVTAETYSKYIHKQDRSARVLFGDGAAVSYITASDSTRGILDIQCATYGKDYDKFIIPAGGSRTPKSIKTAVPVTDSSGNIRTLENIHMDGMGIMMFVNSKVPQQIRTILSRNDLSVDNIDLFVFHQASKMALDSITRLLKINPAKVFRNLTNIGNTVSASIPIALKDALESKAIAIGDKVLVSGFGVGLSWGTAIIEI
jgi:3-oxoacyl-[acyl-carrier-protein] synthase-3